MEQLQKTKHTKRESEPEASVETPAEAHDDRRRHEQFEQDAETARDDAEAATKALDEIIARELGNLAYWRAAA